MTSAETFAEALKVAYGETGANGIITSRHNPVPYGRTPPSSMTVKLDNVPEIVQIGRHVDRLKSTTRTSTASVAETDVLHSNGIPVINGKIVSMTAAQRNAEAFKVAYGAPDANGIITSGHSLTPYGHIPHYSMTVKLNESQISVNIGRRALRLRTSDTTEHVSEEEKVVLQTYGVALMSERRVAPHVPSQKRVQQSPPRSAGPVPAPVASGSRLPVSGVAALPVPGVSGQGQIQRGPEVQAPHFAQADPDWIAISREALLSQPVPAQDLFARWEAAAQAWAVPRRGLDSALGVSGKQSDKEMADFANLTPQEQSPYFAVADQQWMLRVQTKRLAEFEMQLPQFSQSVQAQPYMQGQPSAPSTRRR